jgi:uncharacterized protein (TIGR03083 family)
MPRDPLRDPAPCYTAPLLAPLHAELLSLLRGLPPAAWEAPTVAGAWRVRDVAAHILDSQLRRLSLHRDGHPSPIPKEAAQSYESLLAHLNRLNAEWVTAAHRLSPNVLVELLAFSGPSVASLFESLPPHGPARWPVAWAGEERSEHWMDIGREYTEHWHHQAQIRDAVGARPLSERRWLHPMLDISLRVLPHRFDQAAPASAKGPVVVEITGDAGGTWSVLRTVDGWRLKVGTAGDAAARIVLDDDAAWRLFFNALPRTAALARVRVGGDAWVRDAFLGARAVMV